MIGASMSEPLFSDVYVDFVCICHGPSGIATAHALIYCTWTVQHGNGACVSFFARGSVCYYGYSLSSEHG